jgi:anti-sigma regulatory factor (Ser/Thr protein kinase)
MMAAEEKTVRIPADVKAIALARQMVAEVAMTAGLRSEAVHHCTLAVEEACANIIEHGYDAGGASGQCIDVICVLLPDKLLIRILDDSPPYNPLSREDPNPGAGLEQRERGGWGVYFIKQLMDDVAYSYQAGRNQLELTKYRGETG